VLGAPDTTQAGDVVTAWASASPDGQAEWLVLEYAQAVVPSAIFVYETFNPGALVKASVFNEDGIEEVVWSGSDPTPPAKKKGLSAVPVKVDYKVRRIKLYLDSPRIAGWNEIDAVGLRDSLGDTQWAVAVEASSTYAEQQPAAQESPQGPENSGAEMKALETENRRLKAELQQLRTRATELEQGIRQQGTKR
jgi:hypothetical protein